MPRPKKPLELSVPKLTDEELAGLAADDAKIRELSLLAVLDKTLPPLPKNHTFKMRERRDVELVHHACFELVGGVPRMVQWAQENPGDFFKQYARLLPPPEQAAVANTQIIINSTVPKSELDTVEINTMADHLYDARDEDGDEIENNIGD